MRIKQFVIPGLAQYSYLISDQGQAVIIDPIRDIDRYLSYLSEHHLTLTCVLETHIHADFAAGSRALVSATGAQLGLSAYDHNEHYSYAIPHRALRGGDKINFGQSSLSALHTPGHTPEHLSFILRDNAYSSTEAVALFSGDFLFAGSVGRPDLLGEDAKVELARELYRSMHQRIADLPDGVRVYPGHGAGSLCGSGMSEHSETTLGHERATNPLFRLSEEAFIHTILASVPPMPPYYPRMKKLNSAGALPLADSSLLLPMTAQQLSAKHLDEKFTILDLRPPGAFADAHIPGAINIGAGENLSLWAGWLLAPDNRIVLVIDSFDDALHESHHAMARVGLDHVTGYLDGGMRTWIEAGYTTNYIRQVRANEVQQKSSEVLILDVRNDAEWKHGHIAGATHIMLGHLPQHMVALPSQRPIITVCGGGYRSSIAASLLRRYGFTHVSSVEDGMSAWNRLGLPLST